MINPQHAQAFRELREWCRKHAATIATDRNQLAISLSNRNFTCSLYLVTTFCDQTTEVTKNVAFPLEDQ